ncbi:MAG: tetratricopeptide repeat protein [bacterium]
MMEENNTSSEVIHQVSTVEISPNISELFKKGLSSYTNGNIEEAVEIFKSIISTNPEIAEAHVNLGNSYFKLGKINESISCWKKALSLDPTQINCYINIGNAYYTAENISEAIANWHVAITMVPDHLITLMNLGAAYEKLNNKSNAFKYYEQYLKYCPKNKFPEYEKIYNKVKQSKSIGFHNLKAGINFQKKGDFKKAVDAYLKSIKIYPNHIKAYLNLGSICYKSEKFEHAVKYWLEAVKLDPDYNNIYCNLGVAYDKLKQYDNAFCMYSRYLKICTQKNHDYYSITERLEQIKKHLNIEISKKYLNQAEEFYKKNKYTEALWEYENYILLNPDQTNSYKYKIIELKEILNPIKKAARIAFEAGNICFEKQKFDKAIQAYKRYIYLEPDGEYSEITYKRISECSKFMRR